MSEFEKRRENFEADLQFFLARATSGVTIDDLPAAAALADDDALEIQTTSGSAKITIAQIKTAIGGGNFNPFAALDNTGQTDVTAAMQKIITDNAGQTLYIPDGTYKVNTLTIPSNTHLVSVSATLQQGTPETLISIGAGVDNVVIRGLALIGTNSVDKPATETASKGILVNGALSVGLHDLTIKGFGTGIEWTETGYKANQKYNYCANLSNINVYQCYYGYRANTRGEFFNIVGCRAGLCYFGAWIGGGNNMISNCQFNRNSHGVYIDGGSLPNHGHGSLTGCQFNHNTGGKSIWLKDVTVGYMVTGGQFYDGQICLEGQTKGVIFTACEGGTWTIQDDTEAGYDNLMMGCYFHTAPGGNWASKLKNQYNIGVGANYAPVLTQNDIITARYNGVFNQPLPSGSIGSAGPNYAYYVSRSLTIPANTYVYGIIARINNYDPAASINAEAYLLDTSGQVTEIVPFTQIYQDLDGIYYVLCKLDKVISQDSWLGACVNRDSSNMGLAYVSKSGAPAYSFGSGQLTVGQTVAASTSNINMQIGYLARY